MRFWTIQPKEVADVLLEKGEFICDSSKSPNQESAFRNAYKWLGEKMEEKISKRPEGVTDPIWAWYKIDWKNAKPDMRLNEFRVYEPSILLELEIPETEVLLSDFDNWHAVLNHWYLDECTSEEEWEKCTAEFEKLPIKEQEKLILKSWDRVFNIEPFKNDFTTIGRYVQATFWKLKSSYVKKVWNLNGYPKPSYFN